MKRRKKKVGCLRQPSSEGPMRSLSIYNPHMDVLTSIIGQSVVHRTSENVGGQRILCLDGGGVKVNKLLHHCNFLRPYHMYGMVCTAGSDSD